MPYCKLTISTYVKDSAGRISQTKTATDEPTTSYGSAVFQDVAVSSTALNLSSTLLATGTSLRAFVRNKGSKNILVVWYKDGATTAYTSTLLPGKFLYMPGLESHATYPITIACAAGETSTADAVVLSV